MKADLEDLNDLDDGLSLESMARLTSNAISRIEELEKLHTENHVYYLRAVYRRLTEYKNSVSEMILDGERFPGLGDEALADEWNWLDCHIDEICGKMGYSND